MKSLTTLHDTTTEGLQDPKTSSHKTNKMDNEGKSWEPHVFIYPRRCMPLSVSDEVKTHYMYGSYPEVTSFVLWTAITYSLFVSPRAFLVSKYLLTIRSVSCPAHLWFIHCMSGSSLVSCQGIPDMNRYKTRNARVPNNRITSGRLLSGVVHSKFCAC